jgi:hypothetical protein
VRYSRAPITWGATVIVALPLLYATVLGSARSSSMDTHRESHILEECNSPIDLAVVLDVSGSMDDDTCSTSGMSNGCDQSWWSEIHDVIFEDFESCNLGDGDTDPDRLCGSNSPWSCEYPWQVGTRNDTLSFSGNYAMTEGDGTDGRFYMFFDASSYDQVEVVLRERTYSAGSSDYNSAWYSREGGGWTIFMDELGPWSGSDTWQWHSYLLPAQTSQFGIMFGSRYMEAYDYGLFDEIRIRGMVNGPQPSGPLGMCPGFGDDQCAGGGYKKQPIWDTLWATDWLITECETDDLEPCLDPALDQVGLAYYSDDGISDNVYPDSGDSATACELTSVYSTVTNALWTQFDAISWTNLGDGIFRGCEVLSNNPSEGHNGRTDVAHAIVLVSDGIPNRPCPSDWQQWQCEQPDTWPRAHIESAVDWAVQNGVVIHTIGLGAGADPDLMADIAQDTGGSYHYAGSTDDVPDIMKEIAQELRCAEVRPDTDGDGLLDEDEYVDQCPYVDNPDSDFDGYLDGVEVFNGWDPCDPNDPNPATPTNTPTATHTSTPTSTSTSTPTATSTSTPTNTPTIWPVGYVPLTLKSY